MDAVMDIVATMVVVVMMVMKDQHVINVLKGTLNHLMDRV